MLRFDSYTIEKISGIDALEINDLMTKNSVRFKRYFPSTLEQNLTIGLAKKFASKKEIEFAKKQEFLFTIKTKKEVIGLVYIKELDWHKKQGEFAYCMGSAHTGKGVMSNTLKVLSKYAFAELGLEILQIKVHKDNLSSVKVAKNNKFIWQKTLLNSYTPPNEEPLDMELYELYKNKNERQKNKENRGRN